jgi:hypothetical protein
MFFLAQPHPKAPFTVSLSSPASGKVLPDSAKTMKVIGRVCSWRPLDETGWALNIAEKIGAMRAGSQSI